MWIIGCDFHPGFQQIAFVNTTSGDTGQLALQHREEAERFYRSLQGESVRVGIEATGTTRWFERLLSELGMELWIGDAAKIAARHVRKQRTDKRDCDLILGLLCNGDFEKMRIWMPSPQEREQKQLLLHRHRLVQMRTRLKNQVQALAMTEGLLRKRRLWSAPGQAEFQAMKLGPWGQLRRRDLLELIAELDRRVQPLDQALRQHAEAQPDIQRLMTHPGVGPIVGTAFVTILGNWQRFDSPKHVASYLGLIPSEGSSGGKQRLGHLSKQGNPLLRWLLVEAAQQAVRTDPTWKRAYVRLSLRKNRQIAIVAIARKLAVRLWLMWKLGRDYEAFLAAGSHAE